MVKRIERVTLYETVYEHLRDSILSNDYLPGDVLSTESIAQDTGVSTTPIREALCKLAADGLVEQSPNKGARVASISQDDVTEVYEVRLLFEPYAAGLAAYRVTDDPEFKRELTQIEKTAEQVSLWSGNAPFTSAKRKAYQEIDLQLGDLLSKGPSNTLLTKIMTTVNFHSRRIRCYVEATTSSGFELAQAINTEHLAIIRAIKEGRPKDAEALVRAHLSRAKERTVKQLAKTLSGTS